MSDKNKNYSDNGELNIYPMYIKLKENKYIIVGFTVFFIFMASIYLRLANYTYTVSLEVIPTEQGNGGVERSNIGVLSSLAGISLNQDSTHFNHYIKIVSTKNILARELEKDKGFMIRIFKSQWDENTNQWKDPKMSTSDNIVSFIKYIFGAPVYQKTTPNSYSVERFLNKYYSSRYNEFEKVGIMTINTSDKKMGVYLLNKIHSLADKIVKRENLKRLNLYILFLKDKLKQTIHIDHRKEIIQDLSMHEKLKVLSMSELPLAAEPFVNGAISSHRPTFPRPSYILILSFIIGSMLGCIYVIIFKNKNDT